MKSETPQPAAAQPLPDRLSVKSLAALMRQTAEINPNRSDQFNAIAEKLMQSEVQPPAAATQEAKDDLAWRLGCMAEAVLSAKVGPQARFFTRQTVDEIVMLLREAEKRIVEGR